jgi:hypothetical protein
MSEVEMTDQLAVEVPHCQLDATSLPLPVSVPRQIVNLILLVYWLLIFEGVLRKWVLPSYQRELFFIRDPFVALIYLLSLSYRVRPRASLFIIGALLMAWLAGILILSEAVSGTISNRTDLLLAAYGWREYFWNIPLTFIIGECLGRDDLRRIVKQTLLAAIPIAVLSYYQSLSQATSAFNAGLAENPENLFSPLNVSLGFMRTTGTFTSNEAQSLFIGSLIAMLLWVWILPRDRRPLKGAALIAATAAVTANLAVSGERQAFLLTLAVVTTAAAGLTLLPKPAASGGALLRTLGLIAVTVVVGRVFFSNQLHALAVRATGPGVGDGIDLVGLVDRSVGDVTHFAELLPDTPLSGYGIGTAGNAAGIIAWQPVPWAEDDYSRNIVELGPILGLAFIIFRVCFVTWLAAGAIRAVRTRNDALALMLVGFIGVIILYNHITGQGSVNGFGWIFAGFCIAATRTAGEDPLS